MDDIMTVKEISRLSHWLQSKGHTPEEILDCIDYIANSETPKKKEPKLSAATNSESSDS